MPGGDRIDALKRVRCPDCLGSAIEMDPAVRESSGDTGLLVCRSCAREMPLTNGVLHAHPRDMKPGTSANLAFYDQVSGIEESDLAHRAASRNHAIKMSTIIEALALRGQSRRTILELGTGNGAHGDELALAGHAYCGLDISAGLLRQAMKRFPSLAHRPLFAADATRNPFQDNIFEGVFCVGTLHHLADPEKGVGEMVRVLAKGGRFAFLEPKRFYPVHLVKSLWHSDVEISAMKMRTGAVSKWVKAAGARESRLSYCVFTPNRPLFMAPVWNAIDAICDSLSSLSFLSVMFCVQGTK